MGLTIHYGLQTTLAEPQDVRALVASLQEAAGGLSFRRVGPVKEFQDREADYEQSGRDDEDRWLKIQVRLHLEIGDRDISVTPCHIIAFTVDPGAGCEPANFGLCQFPQYVEVAVPGIPVRRHATGLTGWSWGSFCKTQFASDPKCGGVENFVRCHVGLVKLLELAAAMPQMTVEVGDESHYWERRDPKELVNAVGNWNEFVAAWAGTIKDMAEREGVAFESAIAGFPNFEHLEAKGFDRLRQSRPNE